MAGGSAVNRGPHTGAGTEGAATDLPRAERKSLISSFDFDGALRFSNLPFLSFPAFFFVRLYASYPD